MLYLMTQTNNMQCHFWAIISFRLLTTILNKMRVFQNTLLYKVKDKFNKSRLSIWGPWQSRTTPGTQQVSGQKRQSGTPKCLEEKKSGVVCIGRFIGRFVYREIYTWVFLYTGGVATRGEVRAISDQLPCPKIRLKLFNYNCSNSFSLH